MNLRLTLPISNLRHIRKLKNTLNLMGIEPWLSIRQADALTGVSIVLTDVF